MISGTQTQVQYAGNGSATNFAFSNKVFAATDLLVNLINNTTGLVTPLSYPTDFTVQNVDSDSGCTVVTAVAPLAGYNIDIRSLTAMLQSTSIKNQGSFLPELHEEFFDRITRELQDLRRLVYTYGIHGPDIESFTWPALPSASNRKGLALVFDSVNGLPTVGAAAAGSPTLPTQAQIGAVLYPQTPFEQVPTDGGAPVVPVAIWYPPGNVLRYGADPLGVLECSSAFVNAWRAYKTIYAPSGTYKVNPINVPSTQYQRELYGDGSGVGRTLLVANGNDHVILFSNAGVTAHSCTLQGFGIQGPGTNITVTFNAVVNAGAQSATLAAPWAYSTTTWNVTFSSSEVRRVTLTNGQTTATWTGFPLANNCTAVATTGGSGIHIPMNTGFPLANLLVQDVTVNNMGGPGVCDHNGAFCSQFEKVQVNNCLDHLFDLLGANTDTLIGCYAQGILGASKCGYRIHGGRPTMIGCNGINGAGAAGLAQYGYIFSDLVAEDGRSSFCMPTMIGCNCEDAMVIGVRNKNGGITSINSTILAPSANYPVTFNAGFVGGETSGTLASPWTHFGGFWYVQFSNGDVRLVLLSQGNTTAQWGVNLSGVSTANANTNTVDLLVDTVNEPGYCKDLNVLLQTKGATLANGIGTHTRSNNNPWYFAMNQVTESTSFYDDTGQASYTFGCVGKSGAISPNRYGALFGDIFLNDAALVRQRADVRATVTYSASMTPDASAGGIQEITATNGSAFTVNAPTNPINGQQLTLVIRNTSGGALGAATFNAAYHLAGAWTNPATGFSRSVTLYYNNSVWIERGRTPADVAN